jgi:NADH-quinone oxidoreductase subunit A
VGWAGYIEVLVFTAVLLAALVYLWKLGGLEWADTRRQEYDSFKKRTPP